MSQQTAEHAFDTPDPIELYVENGRGTVTVTATDGDATKVHVTGARAEEVVVDQSATGVSVVAPKVRGFSPHGSLDIEISVPSGSGLSAKLGGARLETVGTLDVVTIRSGSGKATLDRATGPCVVTTGSGAVSVTDAAADLRVRSGSGKVTVDRAAASAAVSTGSGSIRLGHCGGAVVAKTGSGNIAVDATDHDVTLTTGSGNITVGTLRGSRARLKVASGNIEVGIPEGTPVWTDIRTSSGRVRSDLPTVGQPEPGADYLELRATTASGNVRLTPT